ncbi:hypothetical protein NLI96_g477 [Meripilus lineatus]|uniref:Uncharacterized protein n=1 Tax=Meripilus lineatus TaxID=2056292 RepID=A0AAD5YIG7_9APHY|nr:hypothetical protein NLI96_g477 [Physisporinus lineatus]
MSYLKSLRHLLFPSYVSKWTSTAGALGTHHQPNSIEEISVRPRINDDYPVDFKEPETPPDIRFQGEDYTTIRILNVLRWESEYQGILKGSIDDVAQPTPEGIVAFSLVVSIGGERTHEETRGY